MAIFVALWELREKKISVFFSCHVPIIAVKNLIDECGDTLHFTIREFYIIIILGENQIDYRMSVT